MSRFHRAVFPAAAVLFFVAPGHRDAWFRGLPLGLFQLAIVAVIVVAWCMARDRDHSADATRAGIVLVALTVVKISAASLAPPIGWVGRYYSNASFEGAPRRSTEFVRLSGATRVDPVI